MILTQSELTALANDEAAQPLMVNGVLHQAGAMLQRQRIAALADKTCSLVEGDLIEIGSYYGSTSELLAQVARKYDRKLICVDNWAPNPDWDHEKAGREFAKNMAQYNDVLVVIHDDAHAPQVIEIIKRRMYALAFCDDGHSEREHIIELETLLPVCDGLIAVDDVEHPGVTKAIDAVVNSGRFPGWEWLHDGRVREDWLVKQ